jgi:hypothetical protein
VVDGEADDELVAVADAPVLAVAVAVLAVAGAAVLAPVPVAALAFSPDTAAMSEKSREAAKAKPTISVMTGVGIFMPRGTQHRPPEVQRLRRT